MVSKKVLILRFGFLGVFALMVLVGRSINFSNIIGADNQFFTFYQFVGPIAGSFLGTTFGVISVLAAEIANFLIAGKEFSIINLLRLTPMLFGAYYFGNKKRLNTALIPAICMAMFLLHPVGRQAWPYTLYWLMPIAGRIMPNNTRFRTLIQSFGATFTAHAVGSTLWLYTVPMDSAQWLALIPIVAFERMVFSFGIFATFHATKALLKKLSSKISIMQSVLVLEKSKEMSAQPVAVKE